MDDGTSFPSSLQPLELLQGDSDTARIKLPSFKEVQERAAKRARVGSLFGPSSSVGSTRPASTPAVQASASSRETSQTHPAKAYVGTNYYGLQNCAVAVPTVAATPVVQGGSYQQRYGVNQTVKSSAAGGAQGAQFATNQPSFQAPPRSNAQYSDVSASASSYAVQVGHGNAILVNKNQQGNPVLKCLRNINYRISDVIPDYQFNDKVAALFLSLRFHKLQPLYIHSRIKALQRNYRAFLLCHCDVDDPVAPLADVTKIAIDHNCTLIVAFSPLECARYLELLKAYENKSADAIMPRVEAEYTARMSSVLTSIRAVNKTDCAAMGTAFGSVASLFQASESQLTQVPGLGPTKVKRLCSTFSDPFFRDGSTAVPGTDRPAPELANNTVGPPADAVDLSVSPSNDNTRLAEDREFLATQEAGFDDGADEDEHDFL